MLVNINHKEVSMPEDKEFMTLDEAAKVVGLKRPSLYFYIKKLSIQRRYFPNNRHAWIAHADVERIKMARERPWELEEDTDKRPAVKPEAA
jgi:predicted DNA-binding transcriptional regulator AlpA